MRKLVGRISMKGPLAWGLLAALAVMTTPLDVFAAPITFTQTGTGTGQIGTTSFVDAAFTITALADTANCVRVQSGIYSENHSAASISISGLGSYVFISGTRTFVNQNSDQIGFSRAGAQKYDLFSNLSGSAFADWDMLTSVGPVTGWAQLKQWQSPYPPVETTGGALVFDDAQWTMCTFTATVGATPEPSTFALLATGFIGLLAYGWRRRRKIAGP
jgi:hypothetical protein